MLKKLKVSQMEAAVMCTSNRSKYVKYLSHCPRCNRYGGLYALFTKNSPEGKEYGPYFYVMHSIMGFDKEKYHKLRSQGVSYSDARGSKSGKIKYSWKCYIGINSDFAEILASKAEGLV